MLVQEYLPSASKRLRSVMAGASIQEAAQQLAAPGIDLIVVTDAASKIGGVVTDSDIVTWVASHAAGVTSDAPVETIMSTNMTTCTAGQSLQDVAEAAQKKGLKHLPIVDDRGVAIGVLYVREALLSLLKEAEINERWMNAYITGSI